MSAYVTQHVHTYATVRTVAKLGLGNLCSELDSITTTVFVGLFNWVF